MATLLAVGVLSAWAGPTGLTVIPTADVLEPATGSLEFEAEGRRTPFGGDGDSSMLFEIGLPQGIEAGIDTSITSSEGPWLNVKWLVAGETQYSPAVAIGLQGIGQNTTAESYVAVSKDVGKVRLHTGGIRTGHHFYGMVGAEVQVGPRLTASADAVSGHAGTTSVGLGWEISDTVTVAGARILADAGNDRWYLNIGYTLTWSQ